MRGWQRIVSGPRVAVLAMAGLSFPQGCGHADRFECGIKVDGNVTQCDEPNQVCICGKRRCAQYAAECTTRYKFVFGAQDCIEQGDLAFVRAADPSKPDNALCPEVASRPAVAQPCGDFDRISGKILTCASASETCVCTPTGGICATNVGKSCPGEFAANGACLSIEGQHYVQTIAANELCLKSPPSATPCGTSNAEGRLQQCPSGLECGCAEAQGRCLKRVEESVCASGMRIETDSYKQCAPDMTTIIDHGLCAGAKAVDVSCGAKDANGRVGNCVTGESCVCAYSATGATGSCARKAVTASAACSTGLERVSDGECISLSDTGATVTLNDAAARCPAQAPDEVGCGTAPSTECAATSLGCYCGMTPHTCVVEEPGCDSGVAFAGSHRCLTSVDRKAITKTKACPVTDEGGDGGAGGEAGSPSGGAGGAQ